MNFSGCDSQSSPEDEFCDNSGFCVGSTGSVPFSSLFTSGVVRMSLQDLPVIGNIILRGNREEWICYVEVSRFDLDDMMIQPIFILLVG